MAARMPGRKNEAISIPYMAPLEVIAIPGRRIGAWRYFAF